MKPKVYLENCEGTTMSTHDPIVAEVRKAHDDYARKFNYDLDLICADLRRREKLSGATVVTLPKRSPILAIPAAVNQNQMPSPAE